MWQLFLCAGLAFLILEMFTPAMFFLNFAIAAFICAGLSLITTNITILIVTFSVLSVILIFCLRPMLMKNVENKKQESGMDEKYIGKIARVIEDIDKTKGAITIYDERWQARNIEEGTINKDEEVEIISYDSTVLNVRKV